MTPLAWAILGFSVGLIAYLVLATIERRRVELALRMLLDRRDQELERERDRADKLLERLLTLRKEGYVMSRAGQVREAPDPEGEALRRGEAQQRRRLSNDQFLTKAIADIKKQRPDISDAAAVKEARRLLEAARMEQPPA